MLMEAVESAAPRSTPPAVQAAPDKVAARAMVDRRGRVAEPAWGEWPPAAREAVRDQAGRAPEVVGSVGRGMEVAVVRAPSRVPRARGRAVAAESAPAPEPAEALSAAEAPPAGRSGVAAARAVWRVPRALGSAGAAAGPPAGPAARA